MNIKNKIYNMFRDSNNNYNRAAAKVYAEKYALNPNTREYPYFKNDDCANFISQVLKVGGMREVGTKWGAFQSWFCNTTNHKNLTRIAITWRAARYFRKHWGNENGIGRNRTAVYKQMTVEQVLNSFSSIYNMLNIGDVIQYGNPRKNNYPYHTQVIHDKGYNWRFKTNDLFMAQHTANRLNVSFYDYLNRLSNKNIRMVYIYRIRV